MNDDDTELNSDFGDRHRISSSAGRDSIIGSRVTQFISSNKDLLLGLMFGIAIIEGAALFFEWRAKTTAEDLKNYDLTQFQAGDFADLKAKVISDHELIQAYGLQRTVIDNCRSK